MPPTPSSAASSTLPIAIASTQLKKVDGWDGATYEIRGLVNAIQDRGLEAIPLPLDRLQFDFHVGAVPEVLVAGVQVPALQALIVRRTGRCFDQARMLTEVVEQRGSRLLDPRSRFMLGGASKLVTTDSRHQRGVGSTTLVAFDHDGAMALRDRVREFVDLHGGAILKPMSGAQGKGIELITSVAGIEPALARAEGPVLIQPRETIDAEFRALMHGGICVGMARKRPADGQSLGNAAQGASFTAVTQDEFDEVMSFVNSAGVPDGLVGVDVAKTPSSMLIIEENFAPQWKTLDLAVGRTHAEEIVQLLLQGDTP